MRRQDEIEAAKRGVRMIPKVLAVTFGVAALAKGRTLYDEHSLWTRVRARVLSGMKEAPEYFDLKYIENITAKYDATLKRLRLVAFVSQMLLVVLFVSVFSEISEAKIGFVDIKVSRIPPEPILVVMAMLHMFLAQLDVRHRYYEAVMWAYVEAKGCPYPDVCVLQYAGFTDELFNRLTEAATEQGHPFLEVARAAEICVRGVLGLALLVLLLAALVTILYSPAFSLFASILVTLGYLVCFFGSTLYETTLLNLSFIEPAPNEGSR